MASAMNVDGNRIRVDWPTQWIARVLSLPFLAAGGFLLWNVALGIRNDFAGFGRLSDDLVPILVFSGIGIVILLPGLYLATYSSFVELNKSLAEVVVTRAFGPLRFRSQRQLADFHFLSITDRGTEEGEQPTLFHVSLCGNRGTEAVALCSFSSRDEANAFAHELGRALKLPARDYVGTEPDADEES
ncbi:hypothetical protein JQ596_29100 [Bradyrhizobium manausense]|uniref:hypothetical protein n=1 Tax=Bradyrhizobium TaxID=374 RepID=UPI001BA45598|nr:MULTISPECIES: hypothetical protein [Bradyrhizobium]MBR0829598.1 hypothetical protein [Bradyrhizobium manausense]UVO25967.1 hypothetical protein KUF59_25740 [Bradyrhizobium arachidis]